jgi:hypothetical protein
MHSSKLQNIFFSITEQLNLGCIYHIVYRYKRLDWALFGDEGIEDVLDDTTQKVKGRRELLNLECSINYDAKGASSRCGKGKAHA